ncbi:MAG TPA: alkaline phosphatase family protein [Anaerolineae bacterium]|nr:alkaline phosphatase family protein [Anaerolineae bacterium]
MKNTNRVLVIGLDGATWDVLERWVRDGTMPNLARLRRNGAWGVLASSIPPITAAAWSTFMTGKRPGKHGVYHFINLFEQTENQVPELVSSRSIQAPALWDILGHHGRQVVLVNIPLTYPPRPVNGVMVTGLLTPRNAPVFTYPGELSQQITDYKFDLDRFVDKSPFLDEIDGEIVAPTLTLVNEFREMLEMRRRVTLSLMKSEAWDFYMVVFIGTDRMGHYLWHYQAGTAGSDPQSQELAHAVREYYIRLDEIIGELVSEAGEGTTTLLMSDHGMGPKHTKRFHINNWLRNKGWLCAEQTRTRLSNPDSLVTRLGIPRDRLGRLVKRVPGLAKSRVIKKAADTTAMQIDLEKSTAYAIPMFNHIFGIRLNVPADSRLRWRMEIRSALEKIIDPTTGKRIVEDVIRGQDYYQGVYAKNIPDLIVMLNPDYGASFRLGRFSSVVTELQEHTRRGKHRMEGIFVASGPGIQASEEPLRNIAIEDVAPTTLALMGLPVPNDMDGRVLGEMLTSEFTAAHPIESGEPIGFWGGNGHSALAEPVMSEQDEAEIRERLAALGYLE